MSTSPDAPETASASRVDLLGMPLAKLQDWVVGLGQPRFRALQIFKWIYQHRAHRFDDMTNVSKAFRAQLEETARIGRLELVEHHGSDDGSGKYIWRMADGLMVESVLIPEESRLTLCISSQVGCPMDCDFCVTGKGGFTRNLSAGEIIAQVLQVSERATRRISNIVLMGMGEPLLNLDEVLEAMDIAQDDNAFGMSHRRITLSTVGIPKKMRELHERSPINLAISLHGTTQARRADIMPISRKYPLEEVLGVVRDLDFGRKFVTIEYILLRDINDDQEDARRLVAILDGLPVKVNLIPYNENPHCSFERPSDKRIWAYQKVLLDAGLVTVVRNNRGNDIDAACGQLGGYKQARPGRESLPVV